MEIKKISSAQNEYIKKLAKLSSKKHREEFKLFIAEGEHLVEMVLGSEYETEAVIMSESYYEKNQDKINFDIILVPDSLLSKISDAKTPQGILAVVKLPCMTQKAEQGRYIYCDDLQDPGNLGTVIRTADAFSFDGVVVSQNSADIFSPKVIRSSQGSVFNIKIIIADNDFINNAKSEGFYITSTALYGECVELHNMKIKENQIFVIGNEGSGVSKEILKNSDEIVYIPMTGKAESLNAGVAASILMYEVHHRE